MENRREKQLAQCVFERPRTRQYNPDDEKNREKNIKQEEKSIDKNVEVKKEKYEEKNSKMKDRIKIYRPIPFKPKYPYQDCKLLKINNVYVSSLCKLITNISNEEFIPQSIFFE